MLDAKPKTVPLNRIDSQDKTFAWRYREPEAKELEPLCDSLRESGLIHPLVVRAVGEKYQLVSGFRRLAAIQLLNGNGSGKAWGSIACRVVGTASAEELHQLAYDENHERQSVSPMEEALTIDRLSRERNLKYEEIGKMLRIKPKTVQRYKRLLRVEGEVAEAVHQRRITYLQGAELAGLPRLQQLSMLKRIIEDGLSIRDLKRALRASRVGEDRGRRYLARVKREMPEGASMRVKAGGRVVFRLEIDAPETKEELLFMLEARVAALRKRVFAVAAE
jgi:ParB/RepB/Spo0J family partition protein